MRHVLFQITVDNFQSLSTVEITVDKFTVVCGTNNAGKSAVMRAVRAAFTNAPGHSYVRHGEPHTTVRLQFPDAPLLTWQKGEKFKPLYTMGEASIHPGRGTPDELSLYRILPLDTGGEQTWPQFAPQFTGQVYLLDKSGSAVAEAVADPDQVGRLHSAMSAAEKDLRSVKAEIKVRRTDLADTQNKLAEWAGFDDVETAFEAHQALEVKQKQRQAMLQRLQALHTRIVQAQSLVKMLSAISDLHLPDMSGVNRDRELLNRLRALHQRWVRASASVAALDGLGHLEIPEEKVRARVAMLTKLQRISQNLQSASEEVIKVEEDIRKAEQDLVLCESDVASYVPVGETLCPTCQQPIHPGAHP